MRFFLIIGMLTFGSPAYSQTAQSLKECRAISDNLERLSCFDKLIAPADKKTNESKNSVIGVVDFITDINELVGKQVKVGGFAIAAGQIIFLYPGRGEMSGVMVDITRMSRADRHTVLSNCGSGCDIVITGKATNQFGQSGITAISASLQ
ncbi:MAG: hypothetical protein Q8Q62_18210 [Mesorhizobium sp.]|nr:hypothetical protein [Mesorhizobium sp.]